MNSLISEGFDVIAVSPKDEFVKSIEKRGIKHFDWNLSGSGINPVKEVKAIWQLYRLLNREKIDVVLTYTPKGNIYGSIATRMMGAEVINNISGLGRAFVKNNFFTFFVTQLYKIAFHRSKKIFFQNEEDLMFFLRKRIVSKSKSEHIPGSGVDLKKFAPQKGKMTRSEIVFLLVARLLWDKGVGEFVEAARLIRMKDPSIKFRLLGFLKADNPSAISIEKIDAWVNEGIIEYLGSTKDVTQIMAQADCVVLPSYYREGVPRSLLEAASMAIPIITTDFQGCRDAVDNGVSGLLCKPKNSLDLANKMMVIANMSEKERSCMGLCGRAKMEKEFDEKIVIKFYLSVLGGLENNK